MRSSTISPIVRSLSSSAESTDHHTLAVFDFDWTLFRSPYPAAGKARKKFLSSPESLSPPLVPWLPGAEYWIEGTVDAFKVAQLRGTLIALVTGRRSTTSLRVCELLEQKGLYPDYFAFRSSSNHRDKYRVHFKRVSVLKILDLHPAVKTLTVWEDDPEQIASLKDAATRMGLKFSSVLVTDPRNPHG